MICLDTNIVIRLLARRDHQLAERFRRAVSSGIVVPMTVLFELWYGVMNSNQEDRNRERLEVFLSGPLECIPFDENDARVAGQIRAQLKKAGTPIGAYDLLIAAQARARGAVLATLDAREFSRVPALAIDDWGAS